MSRMAFEYPHGIQYPNYDSMYASQLPQTTGAATQPQSHLHKRKASWEPDSDMDVEEQRPLKRQRVMKDENTSYGANNYTIPSMMNYSDHTTFSSGFRPPMATPSTTSQASLPKPPFPISPPTQTHSSPETSPTQPPPYGRFKRKTFDFDDSSSDAAPAIDLSQLTSLKRQSGAAEIYSHDAQSAMPLPSAKRRRVEVPPTREQLSMALIRHPKHHQALFSHDGRLDPALKSKLLAAAVAARRAEGAGGAGAPRGLLSPPGEEGEGEGERADKALVLYKAPVITEPLDAMIKAPGEGMWIHPSAAGPLAIVPITGPNIIFRGDAEELEDDDDEEEEEEGEGEEELLEEEGPVQYSSMRAGPAAAGAQMVNGESLGVTLPMTKSPEEGEVVTMEID